MIWIRDLLNTLLDTIITYIWWGLVDITCKIHTAAARHSRQVKHALLLAWSLPPSVSAGVYRATSFLRYGPQFGWRLSAISGPIDKKNDDGGHYLAQAISTSVAIYRLDPPQLKPSWRLLWIDGGFVNALATLALARKELRSDPPSVVVASGPPFHNFVAAYYVAEYFDANLVLDYRDPWTEGTRDFVSISRRDRWWEKRCIGAADFVFFATSGFYEATLRAFPSLDAAKCQILHNGWDPDDFRPPTQRDEDILDTHNQLLISFVGRSGPHSSPDQFLKDLGRVFEHNVRLRAKIKVQFIGTQYKEALPILRDFERTYPGTLEILPEKPKPDAIQAMQESSCLLLLNNEKNCRVIPSKFFEYVATDRPILLHGVGGEMEALVSHLGAGVMVPLGDPDALERALLKLQNTPASEWSTPARAEFLQTHTREVLAERMFGILDRL